MISSNNPNVLITVASWEERFVLGFKRSLHHKSINTVIMFFYKEYFEWSKKNIDSITAICNDNNIGLIKIELSFENPKSTWIAIYKIIMDRINKTDRVILDISTAPRETIWSCLFLLENYVDKIYYNYNCPETYNDDWLSRDPYTPRLIYKLGGIARLGYNISLILITGYDSDRVRQFINFYEPKHCYLFVQKGAQFGNPGRNPDKYIEEFKGKPNIYISHIDSYDMDKGYITLKRKIREHVDETDLIMSSLGPKMSAVALYSLHRQFINTALAYGPSRHFNKEYSKGISKNYFGEYKQITSRL